MSLSSKIKVAILRGGHPHSYDDSMKTGKHILSALRQMPETYEPLDIFISKDGEWHRDGLVHEPHHALRHVDVVWNAVHGHQDEGNNVESLLEGMKIPFTGSGNLSRTMSLNRDISKRLFQETSLHTPEHELFIENNFDENKLIDVFRTYMHPVVVKPVKGPASLKSRLVHTFDELKKAVKETFRHSSRVLVEEFIKGEKFSCAVIDNARGEKIYALLPTSPSRSKLSTEENKQMEEMAKQAHKVLSLRHYSSSDFIVTPKRKIYILQTNSTPALHEDSLASISLKETGWQMRDFVRHVIGMAI
jgi:D-alanine-D-alanine ligase